MSTENKKPLPYWLQGLAGNDEVMSALLARRVFEMIANDKNADEHDTPLLCDMNKQEDFEKYLAWAIDEVQANNEIEMQIHGEVYEDGEREEYARQEYINK